MSQIPPAPNQPTPPFGPPVGHPVGSPAGYSMAPTQTNGWGVVSLITGLISFCVPVVGGLLGILFGFFGIRRARETHTGKGMSVAGLVLGLISLIGWAIAFSVGGLAVLGIHGAIKASSAQRDAAKQFVQHLNAGDLSAAKADTNGSLSESELQSLSDEVKDLGAVKDITNFSINIHNDEADLAGVATFDKGTRTYNMHEVKAGDGWKVSAMTIDRTSQAPSLPTAPTTGQGE